MTANDSVPVDLLCRPSARLEPALRGVSCVIQPGEKIGICGRTGRSCRDGTQHHNP
jgi:hypothetical protein